MYEAYVYSSNDDGKDLFLGVFNNEFDAKIACERHARTPLRWKSYAVPDHGSYADCVMGHIFELEYIVRPAIESEAAE